MNTQSHIGQSTNQSTTPNLNGLLKGGNKTTATTKSNNVTHLGISNSNTVMHTNPSNGSGNLMHDSGGVGSTHGARVNSSNLRKKMKPYKSN